MKIRPSGHELHINWSYTTSLSQNIYNVYGHIPYNPPKTKIDNFVLSVFTDLSSANTDLFKTLWKRPTLSYLKILFTRIAICSEKVYANICRFPFVKKIHEQTSQERKKMCKETVFPSRTFLTRVHMPKIAFNFVWQASREGSLLRPNPLIPDNQISTHLLVHRCENFTFYIFFLFRNIFSVVIQPARYCSTKYIIGQRTHSSNDEAMAKTKSTLTACIFSSTSPRWKTVA